MLDTNDTIVECVSLNDGAVTTYHTSGYFHVIPLPAGYVYEVTKLAVSAATDYAAQDTNYNTVSVTDASGNSIASVANGPSSGGLDFDVNPATGVDSSMAAAYAKVDASNTASYLKVTCVATGAGRVQVGLRAWVYIKRHRNAS